MESISMTMAGPAMTLPACELRALVDSARQIVAFHVALLRPTRRAFAGRCRRGELRAVRSAMPLPRTAARSVTSSCSSDSVNVNSRLCSASNWLADREEAALSSSLEVARRRSAADPGRDSARRPGS